MKKILIILVMLITQSCAGMHLPRVTPKQEGIDQRFEVYIEEYRNIIGKDKHPNRFKRLHMNLAKLEGSVIGMCWWLLNGEYEIEIDKDYWYSTWYSGLDKQFTIYHELEHCIRYRPHTNRKEKIENLADFLGEIGYRLGIVSKPGFLPDGCPVSLMHSHTFSWSCQQKHYNYYMEEMKKYDD